MTVSTAAHLIANMFQATKFVNEVWDKLTEKQKVEIITDWTSLLTCKTATASEQALAIIERLEALDDLRLAWGKLDARIREQQMGLIATVIANLPKG